MIKSYVKTTEMVIKFSFEFILLSFKVVAWINELFEAFGAIHYVIQIADAFKKMKIHHLMKLISLVHVKLENVFNVNAKFFKIILVALTAAI